MSDFIPAGKVAQGVVISLAGRIPARSRPSNLTEMLQASIIDIDERKRLEVERGKALIAKGLGLIRDNASADAAIAHLKSELAAITGCGG